MKWFYEDKKYYASVLQKQVKKFLLYSLVKKTTTYSQKIENSFNAGLLFELILYF